MESINHSHEQTVRKSQCKGGDMHYLLDCQKTWELQTNLSSHFPSVVQDYTLSTPKRRNIIKVEPWGGEDTSTMKYLDATNEIRGVVAMSGVKQEDYVDRNFDVDCGIYPVIPTDVIERHVIYEEHDVLTENSFLRTIVTNIKCSVCGKIFSCYSGLKRHMTVHSGEKKYVCTECGKSFFHKHTLTRHMKIHSGEKKYVCMECGKSFFHKHTLTRHMKIHSVEKSYVCKECGKKLNQSSNLKSHMKIHSGERNYECKECNKTFSQSCNLKTHMKIHSRKPNYECKECGKKHSRSSNLKSHMKIHSGERNYECKECSKTFSQSCNLKTHMCYAMLNKIMKDCNRQLQQPS